MQLHVVRHPVVEDAVTALRDRRTSPDAFRRLARRASLVVAVEATRDLAMAELEVETPLEATTARHLDGRVVAVPILRAGLGMLDAFLEIVPSAEVGYLGLERDEETAQARRYYEKLPPGMAHASVFVLDPMLATGGSAGLAMARFRDAGVRTPRLLSIVAAPEGVAHLEAVVPEAEVYTAALDRELDPRKFIRPGLGDFGDRLFGT